MLRKTKIEGWVLKDVDSVIPTIFLTKDRVSNAEEKLGWEAEGWLSQASAFLDCKTCKHKTHGRFLRY